MLNISKHDFNIKRHAFISHQFTLKIYNNSWIYFKSIIAHLSVIRNLLFKIFEIPLK